MARYGLLRELLPLDEPELLGELLGAVLDPDWLLLLLFVRMLGLVDEPDGSLIVPRELDDVPVALSSLLPLQPTNNAAALAINNSFFINVPFLPQTVSSQRPLLNP
jgi:hypothetical protein